MENSTGAGMEWADPHAKRSAEEAQELYSALLDAWNRQDAAAFATCFAPGAPCVGFDGTIMRGRREIEFALGTLFAQHPTPRYYGKVRSVTLPKRDVATVNAVAGMVPRGARELDPDLNAVQTMVALRHGDEWRIASFVTTPAAFHGRRSEREALTDELRALVKKASDPAASG